MIIYSKLFLNVILIGNRLCSISLLFLYSVAFISSNVLLNFSDLNHFLKSTASKRFCYNTVMKWHDFSLNQRAKHEIRFIYIDKIVISTMPILGISQAVLMVKTNKLAANAGDIRDADLVLGWEDPWKRACQPTLVCLPRESRGQRSLAVYSSWGFKESDTTEYACTASSHLIFNFRILFLFEFWSY